MRGRLYHLEGDWYEWRQTPALAADVHVRVVPGAGGRLHLAELRIVGEPTSELLRAIPVGRIEAAANAQLAMVDDGVAPAPTSPAHRRARLALTRHAVAGPRGPDGRARPATQLDHERSWDDVAVAAPRARVSRASGRARAQGRPDRFYAEVAETYQRLAQSSPRPAVDLAARNDVPVTTAHRWIKEARRRGYLAPGRPGKAG